MRWKYNQPSLFPIRYRINKNRRKIPPLISIRSNRRPRKLILQLEILHIRINIRRSPYILISPEFVRQNKKNKIRYQEYTGKT